jgi:4'-phosphopantetheinyl transferase
MGSCEVWWAQVAANAGRLLSLLPAADLRRASGFGIRADRDRCVVAAALARLLLAGRLDAGPAQLVIDRTGGKPRLTWPEAAIDFSVSHAGDLVAVAISDGVAAGVDVERLGRLSADPAEDTKLTRSWVRTEAAFKAVGTDLPRSAACTLADLQAPDGYLAALAMAGSGSSAISVTEHDGNALFAARAGLA